MARKKKLHEGIIEGKIYPNKSYLYIDEDKYVFKDGLPGQKVSIISKRKRKDFRDAKLVEILEKSPMEIESKCQAFGVCGGCAYQNISYEDETILKQDMLNDLYKDIYDEKIEIYPSNKVEAYRNKMEYSFGDKEKGGELTLGLHSKGRFYEICDTSGCNIVCEDFEIIRKAVEKHFRDKDKTYFRKQTHKGLLRHLVVRYAFANKEIMVNLVTSSQNEWDKKEFTDMLLNLELDGKIRSILHTTNDNLSDAVIVDKLDLLYGENLITEHILGLDFNISPFSFFQPNPSVAEKLYTKALDMAGDLENKTVLDLYSGTGTISQVFAKRAKKVIAIEIVEEAVEKAKENAKLNNLDNTHFIAGDVLEEIDSMKEKVDIVVLDPPRSGIHPKAIGKILDIEPKTFIYISCNPVTQAIDLQSFLEKGYKIKKLELFDQFPRTVHVEAIVKLERE